MMPKRFITVGSRTYCSVVSPAPSASELFSAQRKVSLSEKVSKLKARPTSSRVVEEGKEGLFNRAAVLVPLISVQGEPG